MHISVHSIHSWFLFMAGISSLEKASMKRNSISIHWGLPKACSGGLNNPFMFRNGTFCLANEKEPGCLGYMSGMKYYPVMWGLVHKPSYIS